VGRMKLDGTPSLRCLSRSVPTGPGGGMAISEISVILSHSGMRALRKAFIPK